MFCALNNTPNKGPQLMWIFSTNLGRQIRNTLSHVTWPPTNMFLQNLLELIPAAPVQRLLQPVL